MDDRDVLFHLIAIWPHICGQELGVPVDMHDPQMLAAGFWKTLIPQIDAYIERYSVPIERSEGISDECYFQSLVSALYELDQRNIQGLKWSAWPAVALDTGVTNCSLGAQVAGQVLRRAGYEVEYGMPGPLTHAVIFVRDADGTVFYLDPANGVTAKATAGGHIGTVTCYQIETEDERIPFRLVPACSLEQSVATTVWNMASLRASGEDAALVERLQIDGQAPYGDWARKYILPAWAELEADPRMQREYEESGRRIGASPTIVV
ncbi:hypothetical protein AUK40_03840 [Candidatus Wirthbacteria bacterium CG2_30_54_11]|uniref:Uncharacterized protein n=1 Tax=Candidatus Wirthbacteria bacterium CG2_30_54_11 TaxID=1817892 RepID=A0A1J5IVF8_9BACT|nr:MAG: hypothetical protein AUK40_03840 [Candidatus Wirthbacteria bacterium CG2_30_54_11]